MYVKIFPQIFDSSIADDPDLRHMFMDLLLLADPAGCVDMTTRAIHARTRVPLEKVERLIAELEKPDPQSRSMEHEGRRLVRMDDYRSWGWRIVNYEKYRAFRDEVSRREYMRQYVAEYRANGKDKTRPVNLVNTAVNLVNTGKHRLAQAEAEAEAEASFGVNSTMLCKGGMGGVEVAPNGAVAPVPPKSHPQKLVVMNPPTREEIDLHAAKIGLPNHEVEKFAAYYTSNGWRVGKNPMKNWQAAMVGWKTRWEQDGMRGIRGETAPAPKPVRVGGDVTHLL